MYKLTFFVYMLTTFGSIVVDAVVVQDSVFPVFCGVSVEGFVDDGEVVFCGVSVDGFVDDGEVTGVCNKQIQLSIKI